MRIKIYSSPLQGFTDHVFRSVYNHYFTGVDYFYAPYIRLKGGNEVKKSSISDILPENNEGINLIPQVMTNSSDEFLYVSNLVKDKGYRELNWNLGCPYPMVAKRGLGSGLLSQPQVIHSILDEVFQKADIDVSVKMRLGYENNQEIFEILKILNEFPIKNIAIHPRTGKQLYKGKVDLPSFEKCLESTKHEIHYNGDITSVKGFKQLKERFPTVEGWLIGRSLISDPALALLIKAEDEKYPQNYLELFIQFHEELVRVYGQNITGEGHLLKKMQQFWEYFILRFPDAKKGYKKLKKANGLRSYWEGVEMVFKSGINN